MCCGKKRATLLATELKGTVLEGKVSDGDVLAFRYTGTTSLTTVGKVSGRIYRFPVKGAVQMIHAQDAVGLQEVPNLVLIAD